MKVCYFGTYDASYIRNQVLLRGLRSQGICVVECNVTVWSTTEERITDARKGILSPWLWWRLINASCRLIHQYFKIGRYDLMVVGYLGHLDVFLGRVLSWLARKPLVFDAYLSIYETVVEDRALVRRRSLAARVLYWIEKLACVVSDAVLLDTDENISYFCIKYHLPRVKFHRVWVGADETVFHPVVKLHDGQALTVLYFGTFIPLHGVEHIVAAAKHLESERNIRFVLVGGGQVYSEVKELADRLQTTNVEWGPTWLAPSELREHIDAADVCLGIFGTSAKAQRVIPTKAYVALAMRKPLITEDSPAARELLEPGRHALLCAPGDAVKLAHCIRQLKERPELRKSLADEGHQLFRERCTPAAIGSTLAGILRAVLHRQ